MNRRKFLSYSMPATGAVLLTNSLLNQQAFAEISRQFDGQNPVGVYDIVINGAGLSGYFAALYAAKTGKKVLLVEKRSSPGYELAAKSQLWMGAEGFDKLRPDLKALFLPEQEIPEIKNTKATGETKSHFGDQIALFKGSVRKGMVRNLLLGNVDLLLMTDVCGLFEDKGQVTGVLIATKQGVFEVRCKAFLDASDQLLFSRNLSGKSPKVSRAGFVLELQGVQNPTVRQIQVDSGFGIYNNTVMLQPGKLSDDHAFLHYHFDVNTAKLEEIEHKARLIATELGSKIKSLGTAFEKAQIHQYALEASLILEEPKLPATSLKGHYFLHGESEELSASKIIGLEKNAQNQIKAVRYTTNSSKGQHLVLPGKKIAESEIRFQEVQEPGFNILLREVKLDWEKAVSKKSETQVVVAGGGTAGALSAAGSVEKGADTIVVDYFNDLGGTKTMGGVMGYYHGVKDNVFFKKQNEEAERVAQEANMTKKIGRQIYHLKSVLDKGGQFITSAILCGAVTRNNAVKGVVVCRNGQLELVLGEVTIDATGDGDVAAFAGASYQIGDERIGYTQNYSQWDVGGVGKLPSHTNRDYDILDNRKIAEQQRGFLISHYEAHFYDFHPFLTVRESRRIDAIHNIDLIDCVEKRHFKDMLVLASSDFDPHNVASSEYSKCGFLLPHSNDITIEIPYRSIVPKSVDGLLISGRGFGQSRNALQFTRMTADLLVLGYFTGQIAADLAWKKIRPRDYDITPLQKEWATLKYFPAGYMNRQEGDKRASLQEVQRRVKELESGAEEYMYECSRIDKSIILPVLKDCFEQTTNTEGKLYTAKMLAWFGDPSGNSLIGAELNTMFQKEQQDGYPKGYIDDYDDIRGREKNKLEGLFWRINQNIALLAMSGSNSETALVENILANTVSGGELVPRKDSYFNGRIDIKFIPFHNRILSLCMYAERNPSNTLISSLEKLLTDKKIGGFVTTQYEDVRWQVHRGSLEISIAAALSRCGSKKGHELLCDYLTDLHFNYKDFARRELSETTKKSFGYDPKAWRKHISAMTFPSVTTPLRKSIEL
ncbi:hypothetical protein DSL64_02290 [Dyadobacter luteus]|uniref:FAD-dependent oxidoreductase n=1 Tax=Dyadobacter luteus TaxID=2259619 RepID=A0A3D8YHZ2_9BACT|nr:FAD-dependent oxidoreductase [Dyadobacter luteus]REA64402.1 hypothetical protein DSL64_02290 [Dyadobacter luteus]